MARSDGYNTKTRQLILDYLINNRQHAVSASNILEHLEEHWHCTAQMQPGRAMFSMLSCSCGKWSVADMPSC